jgi:hypothetical protein
VGLNFLNLPCADYHVCPTEKLLFTGNVLILFFPQDTFASPPAVICEAHVGLSVRVFSGDFAFSPTHFCNEATSWGIIGLPTSVSSL